MPTVKKQIKKAKAKTKSILGDNDMSDVLGKEYPGMGKGYKGSKPKPSPKPSPKPAKKKVVKKKARRKK